MNLVFFKGVLLITAVVVAAVAGSRIVRRRIAPERLKENNEVAGFKYAVVGAIYAVLTAFVIVTAWEQFRDEEASANHEALAVLDVHDMSLALNSPHADAVRENLRAYARSVVNEEWDALARTLRESEPPRNFINAAWREAVSVQPATDREKMVQEQLLAKFCDLKDFRGERIFASRVGIGLVLWVAMLAGGVVTIVFTYFFGMKNPLEQEIMTGLVALVVILNICVIGALDRPFTRNLRVTSEFMTVNHVGAMDDVGRNQVLTPVVLRGRKPAPPPR